MSIGSRFAAGWRKIRERFSRKKTAEEPEAAPVPLTATPDYTPPTPEMSRTTEEYVAWAAGQQDAGPVTRGPQAPSAPETAGETVPEDAALETDVEAVPEDAEAENDMREETPPEL